MKELPFLFLTIFLCLFLSCTSKQEQISKYMKSGMEELRINSNKAAIEDFNKVISLDETNFEAYYLRGNAKFNNKEVKASLLDYNKAIELKPDYAEAFYNRAFCKQYLNDKEGACMDWKKCMALGMSNVSDLLNVCR